MCHETELFYNELRLEFAWSKFIAPCYTGTNAIKASRTRMVVL